MDLNLEILPSSHRITPTELAAMLPDKTSPDSIYIQRPLLVDVRSEPEFNMCRIDGAINYPIDGLVDNQFEKLLTEIQGSKEVIFICRRGNDSQVVAKRVLDVVEQNQHHKILDLEGGLHAWAKDIDHHFPVY